METQMTKKRAWLTVVAASLLAGGLAACGSSGTGGSTSGGSTTDATASGIKVMILGTFSAPSGATAYPEALAAAEARLSAQNKAGGINGTKIDAITCDDQNNSDTAASCAREAVSDHVAAVLSPYTLYSASVLPILQAAKIAWIPAAPDTDSDFSSPISYSASGGGFAEWAGVGVGLAKAGCQKIGDIRLDIPDTVVVAAHVQQGAKDGGATSAKSVATPLGTADFAPAVATVKSQGADCIAVPEAPADVLSIFTAAAQAGGFKYVAGGSGSFSQEGIKQLRQAANGKILIASSFVPYSSAAPGIKQLLAEMKEYQPGAQLDPQVIRAWTGALVFTQVAAKVSGPVTSASFLRTIAAQQNVTTLGMTAPVDFSKPGPVSVLPHLFNTEVLLLTVRDGEIVPISNDYLNVAHTLENTNAG
jgi:ABC-type branched-subunit amino acid transport system substrate-binding protein